MRPTVRHAGAAMGLALLLAASACSKGAPAATDSPTGPRPRSTAHVQIVSPTNLETIQGGTVMIDVKLTGGTIVQATSKNISPGKGHLHVYLDDQLVGMNFALTDTVGGLKPGFHRLRVEFVASDHLPFNPRVFAVTIFKDVA